MKLGLRSSILAIAIFAMMSLQPVKASEYEINQFRQTLSQLQMYEQQYQNAPSNSYEERQANQNRVQAESYAESIINSPNAFQQIGASGDESLLSEFERGYQNAPSNSLLERAYNVARRAAAQALQTQAAWEIQSTYDYNQALQLTQDADRKYQNAPSNSLVESAYNAVRTQGWNITTQKFQDFANNQLQDFRETENLFLNFERNYQNAPSNSRIESFYNQGRQTLLQREIALFNSQASYMSYSDLNAIANEYDRKYQSASSNSYSESLYRSIRDAARSRIGGNPYPQPVPQPYPQPVPQPYPQPVPQPYPHPVPQRITCEIRIGGNASGQRFFRVLTSSGAIIGNFSTTEAASAFAQSDPRCRE